MEEVYTLNKANKNSIADVYFIKKLKLAGLQFDHSCIGVKSVSVSCITSVFMAVI